jgi:hypothetical protein
MESLNAYLPSRRVTILTVNFIITSVNPMTIMNWLNWLVTLVNSTCIKNRKQNKHPQNNIAVTKTKNWFLANATQIGVPRIFWLFLYRLILLTVVKHCLLISTLQLTIPSIELRLLNHILEIPPLTTCYYSTRYRSWSAAGFSSSKHNIVNVCFS